MGKESHTITTQLNRTHTHTHIETSPRIPSPSVPKEKDDRAAILLLCRHGIGLGVADLEQDVPDHERIAKLPQVLDGVEAVGQEIQGLGTAGGVGNEDDVHPDGARAIKQSICEHVWAAFTCNVYDNDY